MKKRIVYATAIGVAACMMFTGCGSNENDVANSDQTIEEATTEASTEASADEVATEAPAEVPTDETATEAPAEAPTDETATETPDEASVDEPAKEAPLMQAGEDEEICLGEIQGFSPDGEHFVVYTYTMDIFLDTTE